MPSSLADPYLKTARAKEHLDDLRERLRVFRENHPCSVTREDDLRNQLHIVRFRLKDVPEKIPLIVGDFAYCLRSSLDQLVWALAKRVGNYPRGTQFPIFAEQTERNEKLFGSTPAEYPERLFGRLNSFSRTTDRTPQPSRAPFCINSID